MINLEPISKKIQERMFEKMRVLGRTSKAVPNKGKNGELTTEKMSSRTTFLRMTSGQTNAVVLMGGKLKDDLQTTAGYNDIYGPRTYKTGGMKGTAFETFDIDEDGDITGFETDYINAFESDTLRFSNNKRRPMPGIKSADISFRGGTKATRGATISWTCWSYEELDILMPHFLTHGKTVMLEWGWIYDKSSLPNLPFLVTDDAGNRFISSDAFTNVKNDVIDGNGDFDMMIGVVKNFEYTTREDGAFDCTTELMSIGINLFENPTPSDTVLDPGITYNLSDSELKNLPTLEAKLKEVVDDPKLEKGKAKVLDLNTNVTLKLFVRNIDAYISKKLYSDDTAKKFDFKKDGTRSGWPQQIVYKENKYLFFDPNSLSNAPSSAKHSYWVRWGWFEDNVLSKFLSVTSKKTGEIVTQFRSIENKLEKGGGGRVSGDYESVRIRNNERLETIDINNYILPGQFHPQEAIPAPEMGLAKVEGKGLPGDAIFIKNLAKIVNNVDNFEPFATKTEMMEKVADLGEDWQTPTGGLTAKANKRLYASDLTMEGKSKQIRSARYQELFGETESSEVAKPGKYGYLRNMLINTKAIKQAFSAIEEDFTVEPINAFESLEILFANLNKDLNIWNFEITVDENEDYRAKIIDNATTGFDFTKKTIEQRSQVSETGEVSTADSPGEAGVFYFPVWRHDSIVKRQNINAKLPNAMQLAAMYGSNLDQLKEFSNPGATFGETTGVLMGGLGADDIDMTKSGLDIAYRNSNTRMIGNMNGYAHEKLTKEEGDDIISFMNNIKLKGTQKIIEHAEDKLKDVSEKLQTSKEQSVYVDDQFNSAIPPPLLNHLQDDVVIKLLLREQTLEYENVEFHTLYSSKFDKDGKMRPHFIKAVKYYVTHHGKYKNANASSLIPLEIELDIDGIGGIYPGNSFHSSYLPKRYQTKTVFQMFEVNHKVDSSGWTVSLTGKMRTTMGNLFDRYLKFGELLQKQLEQYVKPSTVLDTSTAQLSAVTTGTGPGESYAMPIPGVNIEKLAEEEFDSTKKQTLNFDMVGGESENMDNIMIIDHVNLNTVPVDEVRTVLLKPKPKKKKSIWFRWPW